MGRVTWRCAAKSAAKASNTERRKEDIKPDTQVSRTHAGKNKANQQSSYMMLMNGNSIQNYFIKL